MALSCPNKCRLSRVADSGIWLAELTQPQRNKSCRVDSQPGNVWAAVLTKGNLQPITKGTVAGHPGLLASPSCFEKPLLLQFPGSLRVSPSSSRLNSRFTHCSPSSAVGQVRLHLCCWTKKEKKPPSTVLPARPWLAPTVVYTVLSFLDVVTSGTLEEGC